MTFEEWLELDAGVMRYGLQLRPSWVDAARAGWEAATKAEREACAKVCDEFDADTWDAQDGAVKLAELIRARQLTANA